MTLGDRIAIMRDGVLQQLDTPQNVYDAPANVFVAEFIGSPAMNLYEGRLDGTELRLGPQSISLPDAVFGARSRRLAEIGDVIVGIRPEHLKLSANGAVTVIEGEVNLIEALGSDALVHFTLDAPRVRTDARPDDPIEDSAIALPGAPAGDGVARLEPDPSLLVGHRVRLQLDPRRLYFFDPSTGFAL
jgi:multiple sugar transport system ATP-binding protein